HGLEERGAQPLARELQEAKGADPAELNARSVQFHRLLQASFHLPDMARILHIDEVDHDQARQIPQAKLSRDLIRRLEVGLEGGLLNMALARCLPRVDVDCDERLRGIENDRAAGAKLHGVGMHCFELLLDRKSTRLNS